MRSVGWLWWLSGCVTVCGVPGGRRWLRGDPGAQGLGGDEEDAGPQVGLFLFMYLFNTAGHCWPKQEWRVHRVLVVEIDIKGKRTLVHCKKQKCKSDMKTPKDTGVIEHVREKKKSKSWGLT